MHIYKELGIASLWRVTKADGTEYDGDWRLRGVGKRGELYIMESDHGKGFYAHLFIPPCDYITTSHIEDMEEGRTHLTVKTKQSIYYFNLEEEERS